MALSPITTHWFTSEFARLERAGSNINSNLLNWAQFKIAQKHLKLVFFAHLKCPARTSKEVTTVWLDEQINNYTTKTPMIWRRHTQNRGLWLVLVLAICYLTLRVSRVFFCFSSVQFFVHRHYNAAASPASRFRWINCCCCCFCCC